MIICFSHPGMRQDAKTAVWDTLRPLKAARDTLAEKSLVAPSLLLPQPLSRFGLFGVWRWLPKLTPRPFRGGI